jgi:20S proteasome subunit alpha 7
VEKLLLSKLLVAGTNKRVHHVTPNIGIAVTGLTADTRQIVNRARDEAINYKVWNCKLVL